MTRSPTSEPFIARYSIFLFLISYAAQVSSSYTPHLFAKRSTTCPSASVKCTNLGLVDSFCCPSSTSCLSIDDGSSVMCCPDGHDCTYIQTIPCDVSKQDPSLFPDTLLQTSRLNDKLPTCGNLCCPFGYTCQKGNACAMDGAAPLSTSTSITQQAITSSSSTKTATAITTTTTLATSASTTSVAELTANGSVEDVTTTTSPYAASIYPTTTSSSAQYSSASENTALASTATPSTCPDLPTKAIVAGFFPGAVFGAVIAALVMIGVREYRKNHIDPSMKLAQNTHRTNSGTLVGISGPIASDEASFRTDFLLHTNLKRSSEGGRSVLQRGRSRMRSFFGGPLQRANEAPSEPVPPLSFPVTPPRQCERQPSTESIKVYTPPNFATTGVLKPEPYPSYRPGTTLGDMIDQATAETEAAAAAATKKHDNNNTNENNNNNNTGSMRKNPRFLLPPVPQAARRNNGHI